MLIVSMAVAFPGWPARILHITLAKRATTMETTGRVSEFGGSPAVQGAFVAGGAGGSYFIGCKLEA